MFLYISLHAVTWSEVVDTVFNVEVLTLVPSSFKYGTHISFVIPDDIKGE